MIAQQHIPCPVCQSNIPFDPIALVKGHKFSCPNCSAVVGIAPEAIPMASDTLAKYDELKKLALSGKRKAQKQIQ